MEILIKLLIGHLITDFFIQPNRWVKHKQKHRANSAYLYLHVAITAIITWLLLFSWSFWWIALVILVTHYVIDLLKVTYGRDDLWSFLVDQFLHFLVLIFCAYMATEHTGFIEKIFSEWSSMNNLWIIFGYALVSLPSGILIGYLTRKWREDITNNKEDQDSLTNAGIWIGVIERILVFTFVLLKQFGAIGFLIAAKSILRFSDKDKEHPRKQTEYVLIGTLLSFTIALFVGLLVMKAQQS